MVRGLVSVFLWLWRLFPPVLLNMSSVLVRNCVGEEKTSLCSEKNELYCGVTIANLLSAGFGYIVLL